MKKKAAKTESESVTRGSPKVDELARNVLAGNRSALAQAITLLESSSEGQSAEQLQLLRLLVPKSGHSLRIGITGVPGAGKSTLIDALGLEFLKAGRKVAVLAVDPSSSVSGGSILGDKTRMERLAREQNAFIRPSPTVGMLGGVAARTRETIVAVEAAGFDVVLVETVGVGQSEIAVRSMVDCCLLLLLTGAGDELQSVKRGLMELADVLVVSKSDGANVDAAEGLVRELRQTQPFLHSFTPHWSVPILRASALSGSGVPEIAKAITAFHEHASAQGAFQLQRQSQNQEWFEERLSIELRRRFFAEVPERTQRYAGLRGRLVQGQVSPIDAVEELLGSKSM